MRPITRRQLLQYTAAAALYADPWGILPAMAQSGSQSAPYPRRPIELVVPWQAGGGADVIARAYAAAAGKHLPQPIVVVNKPGASGAVGLSDVIQAAPDGYRLALATSELTFLKHLGLAKFSYQDLRPIARLNADPAALIVRADAPWKTLEDFLDAARKADGATTVGNAGVGSTWHMAATALAQKTNTPVNHVPFPGGAPGLLALLGGHIDAVSVSTAEAAAYVEAGKLRALAVMADRREPGYENVPTLKERGIDLSVGIWRGLAAPRDTPDDVIRVLRTATAQAVKEPLWLDTLRNQRFSTNTYADADELATAMARESAFFAELSKTLNIRN